MSILVIIGAGCALSFFCALAKGLRTKKNDNVGAALTSAVFLPPVVMLLAHLTTNDYWFLLFVVIFLVVGWLGDVLGLAIGKKPRAPAPYSGGAR